MAQINLEPAYAVAREEFARGNPEDMARNALIPFDPEKRVFTVSFLGEEYTVYHPGGEVEPAEGREGVSRAVQVLLLHYLVHCSPANVQGKMVSFKELPGGMIYVGPFTNRAIRPLVGIFGNSPSKLVEAGKKLGGEAVDLGDAAVTVPALPKIPITFVLWEGDEEFPPSGNVLFDSSAPSHLHTEDYALLPGLVLSALKNRI